MKIYTKDTLIHIGIEKLKNFGFINVNQHNVFADEVYTYHFKKFMASMLGQNEHLDAALKDLFSTIDTNNHD